MPHAEPDQDIIPISFRRTKLCIGYMGFCLIGICHRRIP